MLRPSAVRWLEGPVLDLRPRTQECYRNPVEQHLLPFFAMRRLDAISADDLALLVRRLRHEGFSESTIVIVIGVANRIYRYAARRLGCRDESRVVDASLGATEAIAGKAPPDLRRA